MTMTDDLVKRHIEQLRLTGGNLADMCQPLADAIEALTAQNLRLSGMCHDLNKEVAISDALLISEAQASLERLARAEKAEADNARLLEELDYMKGDLRVAQGCRKAYEAYFEEVAQLLAPPSPERKPNE
jgi:hypothetical protein